MVTADGEVRWMHNVVEVLFDEAGEVSGIRGVLVDVTQRKVAELARRRAETHLELVAERVEDVLWVRTPERMLYVSPAYEPIWGQTCESLLNDPSSFLDPVHPEDIERLAVAFQDCLAGQRPFDETYRIVRPDGTTRWVHARAAIEAGPDGDLEVGIATDVTERREQEEQLLHTQKLESLGLLAGGIAHDFNNILVSVLGNAELARLEARSDGDVQPLLDEIVRAAERASGLCRQMLAYSGRGPLEREAVDLRQVSSEMEGLLRTSLPKTVDLQLRFAEDLPRVQADVSQVHQVLMNLVMNAGDAVSEGATIRLEADLVDHVPHHGTTTSWVRNDHASGPFVRLRVQDDGAGMDEEQRQRIFDPFYTTKSKGRGLGMSTVLGIVRGHQGAVTVESAPGRGTSVEVLWPVTAAPVGDLGRRVVLVDGEPPLCEIARRSLESAGHEVRVAFDGAAGLELLREDPPEVVVLDPDGLGPQGDAFLEHLAALDGDVSVVLTPSNGAANVAALRGERLDKPYRMSDLRHALGRAIAASDAD
jgi:PAS domain S-box-containing protein